MFSPQHPPPAPEGLGEGSEQLTQNIGGLWAGAARRILASPSPWPNLRLDNHDQTCDNGETMITEALWNLIKHHASVRKRLSLEGPNSPKLTEFEITVPTCADMVRMAGELLSRSVLTGAVAVSDRSITVHGTLRTEGGSEYPYRITVSADVTW